MCSLVRRRGLLKALFNAGNLAAATAALVGVLHLVSGPGQGLSVRTVLGLVLGTLAFTAVNLVALSRVLALVAGDAPWDVVRDGARLSAVMAVGTVALGGTALALAGTAPALLPFTVMPAAALTFAFRAAAQESEERERSSRLLALSQVLAGRLPADELLAAFLGLTREAFGADEALALLDGEGLLGDLAGPVVAVGADRDGPRAARPIDAHERALLVCGGAEVVHEGLPRGWRRALRAPLEAEGRRVGVVLLGTRDRHRSLGERELVLLSPLTGALAVALRSAAHLRRLVSETGKLTAVVEHSSDGILVLDGQGVVQLWSPALQRLTGRTPAEADGRALGPLLVAARVGGGPVDAFRAGRELLRPDSPTATVELVLTRPDGEQRSARCAHAGVFGDDGQLERDVVIVHDVTREREVERLKADFIATVSHELRTPVTPIKGYADLLRKRGHTMTADKRDECLAVISDRATHLARLVEDLLLASRISATQGTGVQGTGVQGTGAQVDLALADLVPLVVRACGDFGDDGARVVLDVPPATVEVDCDRIRVIQVLSNLVGNALKYSSPGAPVQVCLRADATAAVVEVVDRGRGIPVDQLERVFEKFHRVEDPMRTTTGGTGLGLYIARQLAEAMGGSLACTSTLGAGSVFTFTLPRACVAPAAGGGGAGAPAGPAASAWVGSRRTPPWAVPPRRSVAAGPLSVRTLG